MQNLRSNPPPEGGEKNKQNSLSLEGEGWGEGDYIGGVNRYAPKRTKTNAKSLRKNLTEVEKALWYHLRAKRFAGYKFRRQHPVGSYIVDFVCLKEKLIIELDGGQHAKSQKDRQRTAFLQSQGFTVLRFWNNEVTENLEGVLEAIANHLSPSPTLPLKVEGVTKEKLLS